MTEKAPVSVEEALKPLPCPFCGEAPIAVPSGDGTGVMIQCVTDGCVGPHVSYYGDGEATKRWNRRALTRPDPSPGRERVGSTALKTAAERLQNACGHALQGVQRTRGKSS